MADADLRDPDYLSGRVLALEGELGRERERSDLMVRVMRDQGEQLSELTSEVVRQGGLTARTFQIVEALAKRLGLDTDNLPPVPDVPLGHPRGEHPAIEELERIPTRVDREELERRAPPRADMNGRARSEPPEAKHHHHPKTSLPITKSWRPANAAGWAKLAVMAVLALSALAGAVQQIAAALAGH